MTHYTLADILTDENRAAHSFTLMLKAGDTAEHPGSKKETHYFRGPAKLVYAIYPDGVTVHESEAPELAAQALAEAVTAWETASEQYTTSEDEDEEAASELWFAGNALQQAAAKISELISEGHFIVNNRAGEGDWQQAGVTSKPGDFNDYTPDLAKITKGHMLDVFDYGGRDLSHLLIRSASHPETTPSFTQEERRMLAYFAERGEGHFRWTPPENG